MKKVIIAIACFALTLSIQYAHCAQFIEHQYEPIKKIIPNAPPKQENKIAAEAAVAIAATAIETSIKVKNYFDKRSDAKKISDIQKYLKQIDENISELAKQNTEILHRLDKIPEIMRQELNNNDLKNAYLKIKSMKDVFYSWNRDRWDISSGSELLFNFIIISENESSSLKINELIWTAEFLLMVSKYSLKDQIYEIVSIRKGRIDNTIKTYIVRRNNIISEITNDLNSQYVTSKSILNNFEDYTWGMSGHRNTTYSFTELYCPPSGRRETEPHRPPPPCEKVTYTRTVPDTNYNNAHDAANQRLAANHANLIKLNDDIRNLEILSTGFLGGFLDSLNNSPNIPLNDLDKVQLIHSEDPTPTLIDPTTR